MIDFDVAFDKLKQFETSDEIAEFFSYENIQAHPTRSDSCAIAVWLKNMTGLDDIHIFPHKATFPAAYDWINTRDDYSPAMRDFIHKFDTHNYIELVDIQYWLMEIEVSFSRYNYYHYRSA